MDQRKGEWAKKFIVFLVYELTQFKAFNMNEES